MSLEEPSRTLFIWFNNYQKQSWKLEGLVFKTFQRNLKKTVHGKWCQADVKKLYQTDAVFIEIRYFWNNLNNEGIEITKIPSSLLELAISLTGVWNNSWIIS